MSEFDISLDMTQRRIEISPDTLSLHNLALSMAMAGHGWIVGVNTYSEGRVGVELISNNRPSNPYKPGDEAVFAEVLELRHEDDTLADGYIISCSEGRITICYEGVPDTRFSRTMTLLFEFSEKLV